MLGVLGLNARSLLYIKEFNPTKQIHLVNDKRKTKDFLNARGIPVPFTYAHIKTRKQLLALDITTFPSHTYVIKPNKGSQGNGIMIIQDTKKIDNLTIQPQQSQWIKTLHTYIPTLVTRGEKIYHTRRGVPRTTSQSTCLSGGRWIPDGELKQELVPILDGAYNVTYNPDTILIEEKLIPGEDFSLFCQYGLADIRIITFNLVPIAAMVRIPTKQSGGRANLAQGGIACGLDICTGRITSLMLGKGGDRYTTKFPDKYKEFSGRTIPFRQDLLTFSTNGQYFLNIGLVGFDWVITQDGPKLLEVNGRPGLEIQNIIGQPLRHIMEKIEDLSVTTPEKGLEISKSLFGTGTIADSVSRVIFLSQRAKLKVQIDPEHKKIIETIAIVDTSKKKNYMSETVANKLHSSIDTNLRSSKLGNNATIKQGIPMQQRTLTLVLPDSDITASTSFIVSKNIDGNKVSLGTNLLKNYLINPIHKSHAQTDFIASHNILDHEIDDLQLFDLKLHDLTSDIHLAPCLKPTNYLEQFDIFVEKKGNYNPQFRYKYPTNEKIRAREEQQEKLTILFGKKNFQSPFARLFADKLEEVRVKLDLIKAYKKQDYAGIARGNERLFGKIDPELLAIATEKSKREEMGRNGKKQEEMGGASSRSLELPERSGLRGAGDVAIHSIDSTKNSLTNKLANSANRQTLGKLLSPRATVDAIQAYLTEKKLTDIRIITTTSSLSRIAIVYKNETAVIRLATGTRGTFREKELIGKLAHEIDVHLMRHLNGKKSGRHILTDGTAYYLTDEEGLAIWHSERVMQGLLLGYENMAIYNKYLYVDRANHMSRSDLCIRIKHHQQEEFKGYATIFQTLLKLKKGLKDTAITQLGYRKEKIYLEGYKNIANYTNQKDSTTSLFYGKIKIVDTHII